MGINRNVFIILIVILSVLPSVFGSNAIPVYKSDVENNNDYLVPNWGILPFKDIRALDSSYIQWVNSIHQQNWDPTPYPSPDKCLSYSVATMNDWYFLETGKMLSNCNKNNDLGVLK